MRNNMNILGNIDVEVHRNDIIEAIKKNKEISIKNFEEASQTYKKELSRRAVAAVTAIGKNEYIPVQPNYGLTEPVDVRDKYDELIVLFSHVQGETSDLTGETFLLKMTLEQSNAIFNDVWDWSVAAKNTNMFYNSAVGSIR